MNSTADWEQVKEVFSSVLEIEPERRSEFLDERCGDDDILRSEVESWLASHAESEGFIETPVFSASSIIDQPTPMAGRQFGNYRIIREIGHGGMGAVYLARRTDGEFEQEVALKIVRQSIAENQMIERFRRERQILASLNHPNIAKLLDGGVSENGEPYLAMEYVEGNTIAEYVTELSLSLNEILTLFLKVCSAVAYAHRNLVVHRDIKPGNILVTNDGEPKLLDFGLARLVVSEDSDPNESKTAFRALTPAYASPEQLRGETITTASDIYSLGVVLFELVTGDRPFQFEGKSLDEIIKTVSQFEPSLPSNSLSANKQLKGDLDNIILTALRKEPERRYNSVEQFAHDIERYLAGKPVSARPNTLGYRTSKFIKRHSIGVAAGAVVLISLIAGIAGTLWQSRQARLEREKAQRISAFLEETLRYSNPFLSPLKKSGRETTVNEVVEEAARRIENGEFDNDPDLKMELERTISSIFFGQGQYIRAREHMSQYVELTKQSFGPNDPRFITASVWWGGLLFAKGDMAEAEAVYREFIPKLRLAYSDGAIAPALMADSLNNFAYLRRTQGDSREAEQLFRESLEIIPLLNDADRTVVATTRSTLASTIADQGRFNEALETAALAVDEYRQRGETDTPSYGFALNVLGGFLTESGKLDEADATLIEAGTIFSKYLSPTNLWIGDNLRNQAISLELQGKYDLSIEKADAAASMYLENFGKHYDNYPTVLIAKGLSLANSGRAKEAEPLLTEALELRTSSLPPSHFWVAAAKGALGECFALQNRFDEAEPLLRSSVESLAASQESSSPRLLIARKHLASLYTRMGKNDLAAQFQN